MRLRAVGYVPSTNRDDIYFLDVPAYRNRIIVKKADDAASTVIHNIV